MACYFRKSISTSRLVTRQVMSLQPPRRFALRNSNSVLFQPLLLRSYTKPPPPGEFTSAVVLDKYLSKVESVLKKTILANFIGFIFLISADLLYARYRESCNENLLNETLEKGTRPAVGIEKKNFVPRPAIIERLKKILLPSRDESFYYVVCGEHGTGKTILTTIASREVGEDKKRGIQGGRGVIYVNVPPSVEDFGEEFGAALNFRFEENISFSAQLMRKIFGDANYNKDSNAPKWKRALKAFKRAAAEYKRTNPCHQPPVIVYDNISQLIHINPEILDFLQDDAKDNADSRSYIAVFVCSEGSVPRRMESRSAWSRAKRPVTEIGDFSKEESMKYLIEKCNIKEADAEKLYDLVGGRIVHLKTVAQDLLTGTKFEVIKKQVFLTVYQDLDSAKMNPGQANYEAAKIIMEALLNSNNILDVSILRKIIKVEPNDLLKGNIFAYHPENGTVTFQSRSVECYVRENREVKN